MSAGAEGVGGGAEGVGGRRRPLLAGSLAAVVAASLFASLGPLSRFAADFGVGPTAFVFWRAGIGALALGVGIAATGGLARVGRSLAGLPARQRGALAIAACSGVTLNLAIFVAFDRVTIALALMLFYTYPALVALVGVLTGREPLTPARAAALAFASFGVVLVLAGGLDTGGLSVDGVGIVLAFSAALSQTVFITVSRKGYPAVPAEGATVVNLAVSSIGAALVTIAIGSAGDLVAPLTSPGAWPFVVIAGVLAAAVPSFLFLVAIRRIGGTRTGILMLWEPVVGVALAGILLGERLVPAQVVGGALVLGAALVLQLASEPDREPVAPPVELV